MDLKYKEFLLSIGFTEIDKLLEETRNDDTLSYYELSYNIGEGRRGQYYYLLINEIDELLLYSSKPDGDGYPTIISQEFIDIITKIKNYKTFNN